MSPKDLAAIFWRDGFVVVEDFFAPRLMDQLNTTILEHFGTDPAFQHTDEFLSESQTDVIPWFPQNDGPGIFDQIDRDPHLRELTTEILGDEWRSDYCMVMFSKQGSSGQAWHQDCPPDDPRQHNLNRLVYTSDISDDTGGQTVVVPGSHRRSILPAGDPAGHLDDEVTLRPKQGTLLLLHGHTYHRVLPVAGKYRFSANYRATPRNAREDITDVCVYRNMRYRFSTSSVIAKRG